ncbi:hypothetical protein COV04_04540 [Candidatus Uhrbacteria bacterium CG10_big_fil_rev_8_21_14_0_10_48_11]|uniref:Uncharacterized protein n=1 Tax=Candidatus Uhrbacteria bacterium CG10_big_fil_rev_8_21_14_0_10_48_11 TaxID=1975037 RepID=A0A2M8LDF4_9BACT|nr:MAG: hypothetical protein COV04_04540 [Candidatus Uhrbacteria bacterium CG10_big_fil_rev_8_21_14_0_10_48_11]
MTIDGVAGIKRRYFSYEIAPSGFEFIISTNRLLIGFADLTSSNDGIDANLDSTLEQVLSTFLLLSARL